MVITAVVTELSYRFVETPIRTGSFGAMIRRARSNPKPFPRRALISVAAVAVGHVALRRCSARDRRRRTERDRRRVRRQRRRDGRPRSADPSIPDIATPPTADAAHGRHDGSAADDTTDVGRTDHQRGRPGHDRRRAPGATTTAPPAPTTTVPVVPGDDGATDDGAPAATAGHVARGRHRRRRDHAAHRPAAGSGSNASAGRLRRLGDARLGQRTHRPWFRRRRRAESTVLGGAPRTAGDPRQRLPRLGRRRASRDERLVPAVVARPDDGHPRRRPDRRVRHRQGRPGLDPRQQREDPGAARRPTRT